MINCHDGHDVIELYSRLDFRCDCGNGRMPQSCKLFNDKLDYENEGNFYNPNFFDCYCTCKKPHAPEYMDQFMIQCYHCEDWFHNHHLTPKLSEAVDEKYFLLCTSCVEKNFLEVLPNYTSYFHPESKDHICANPEDRCKRINLGDGARNLVR